METVEERVARRERENAELKAENERLRRRVEELMRALEEAQRAGKRQAAPFSRRAPKAHPAKPGRKAGAKYGRRCRRPIPGIIDQTVEAELPASCPHCEGQLVEPGSRTSIKPKYRNPVWSGSSFTFTWGGVSAADSGCRAATRAKHPMQWAARRHNWERGR